MRGLRTMWNQGQPLGFAKKWNPFSSDIPWNTYTSHPLLWHKGRFPILHFLSYGLQLELQVSARLALAIIATKSCSQGLFHS